MDKRPTKGNKLAKISKKEALRNHEIEISNRASILIEQYKKVYDNQIADLKRKHESEVNAWRRKYKKLKTWFIVVTITVTLLAIDCLYLYLR